MNRRRIRRQLHRSACSTFFGDRCFLTVRVPASALPPEPDISMFDIYGTRDDLFGPTWVRKTAAGESVLTVTGNITSNQHPCKRPGTVFGLTERNGWYGWHEIRRVFVPAQPTWFKKLWLPVPTAHVAAMHSHIEWQRTVHEGTATPLLDLLSQYWHAKNHGIVINGPYADVTYRVRASYARAFARDMNHILNGLDRMVKANVLPWYKVLRTA